MHILVLCLRDLSGWLPFRGVGPWVLPPPRRNLWRLPWEALLRSELGASGTERSCVLGSRSFEAFLQFCLLPHAACLPLPLYALIPSPFHPPTAVPRIHTADVPTLAFCDVSTNGLCSMLLKRLAADICSPHPTLVLAWLYILTSSSPREICYPTRRR